jgi:hypothetical protein
MRHFAVGIVSSCSTWSVTLARNRAHAPANLRAECDQFPYELEQPMPLRRVVDARKQPDQLQPFGGAHECPPGFAVAIFGDLGRAAL